MSLSHLMIYSLSYQFKWRYETLLLIESHSNVKNVVIIFYLFGFLFKVGSYLLKTCLTNKYQQNKTYKS